MLSRGNNREIHHKCSAMHSISALFHPAVSKMLFGVIQPEVGIFTQPNTALQKLNSSTSCATSPVTVCKSLFSVFLQMFRKDLTHCIDNVVIYLFF